MLKYKIKKAYVPQKTDIFYFKKMQTLKLKIKYSVILGLISDKMGFRCHSNSLKISGVYRLVSKFLRKVRKNIAKEKFKSIICGKTTKGTGLLGILMHVLL